MVNAPPAARTFDCEPRLDAVAVGDGVEAAAAAVELHGDAALE